MFCSFSSDLIPSEIEWSERLYEVETSWIRKRKRKKKLFCLTVLCSSASLRCFAPWSPIWLYERSTEVSVCMKLKTVGWGREKERRNSFVLPCYAVEHHSGVLLLDLRFDCSRDWVKWVSVWSRKQLDEKEKKEEEILSSYRVMQYCITQMFCSLISDFIPSEIEWNECLYEVENSWMSKRKRKMKFFCLTVLCSRASFRYLGPSAPIWLLSRSSEVSVCMKSKTVGWERKKKLFSLTKLCTNMGLTCFDLIHPTNR
jgi:hypothetical protein